MNDFKDIMNIHYDVKYAGDRVPYYFPLWLEDPTCYPYVYEVENKIVSTNKNMSLSNKTNRNRASKVQGYVTQQQD